MAISSNWSGSLFANCPVRRIRGWQKILKRVGMVVVFIIFAAGCGSSTVVPMGVEPQSAPSTYDYVLGSGDVLDIFVWRNSELTASGIPVRPDGKISTPLVEDLVASGKTPKQLARDVEKQLARYIKDPFVTVTVRQFVGSLQDKIRVVGEAATPRVLPYRQGLTLLDVMISVGGLTEFAAGNRASIVRRRDGKQHQIGVRLQSLLKDGDISANMHMIPGDILIIPESWF